VTHLNLPPLDLDPERQMFAEALGRAEARGRLKGRRILVVGAGQRITIDKDPPVGNGRAIAQLFAREGARVSCLDISREGAEQTRDIIQGEGGEAYVQVADISDAGAIHPAVDEAASLMGGLDGLVLSAGMSGYVPLAKQTAEAWDREQAINLRSSMLFSQRAIEVMDPGSAILMLSSISAFRVDAVNPAYEASKFALIALARSVAKAGEPRGIRCNSLAPGLMDTPMGRDASRKRPGKRAAAVPFGRQGTSWEVAYGALFLISNESSYVNCQCLVVDGGFTSALTRPEEPRVTPE
jgi:NAD(P)-dependent dehydrogenase (short-subunit alcohol dehydrogenase family)